ncbi:MAG: hypothetical protein IKU07_07790 [Oscillospiraceae bacterium]|nr:hypothetical protein [Oscillospiraceae bacterium]
MTVDTEKFNAMAESLPEELLQSLEKYIAEHYEPLERRLLADTWSVERLARPRAVKASKDTLSMEECVCESLSLEEMLRQADVGFSQRLLQLIDDRGCKDAEIYKKACVSKQHFSKIRNHPDYRPTKPTAVAFAMALELDTEQTLDLLGRAGFTLNNSSKFDLIIRYCIENRIFNIVKVNLMLYKHDQPLLGN